MDAIPVISARANRIQLCDYDKYLYKECHLVECFFNEIKWFRCSFSRFDKLDRCYLSLIAFVAVLIWLR